VVEAGARQRPGRSAINGASALRACRVVACGEDDVNHVEEERTGAVRTGAARAARPGRQWRAARRRDRPDDERRGGQRGTRGTRGGRACAARPG
jgi:hypothetical protein